MSVDSPLPLEVLLLVATVSPSAWYSLLPTVKSLFLYSRYNSSFLPRLREKFSSSHRIPGGFETLLPDGTRHGPCRRYYRNDLPPRFFFPPSALVSCSYSFGRLSGEYRVADRYSALTCTFREGELSGLLRFVSSDFSQVEKWRCGREMGLRRVSHLLQGVQFELLSDVVGGEVRRERTYRGGELLSWSTCSSRLQAQYWPDGRLKSRIEREGQTLLCEEFSPSGRLWERTMVSAPRSRSGESN